MAAYDSETGFLESYQAEAQVFIVLVAIKMVASIDNEESRWVDAGVHIHSAEACPNHLRLKMKPQNSNRAPFPAPARRTSAVVGQQTHQGSGDGAELPGGQGA